MSKKLRVSKRGSMVKRRNRIGMAELRHTAIVYHTDLAEKVAYGIDTRTLKLVQINEYHEHAVTNLNHRWTMALITIGIDADGGIDYKNKEVKTDEYFHHKTLIEYFNHEHKSLLDNMNPNFGKKACWIASLEFHEWDAAQVARIMALKKCI